MPNYRAEIDGLRALAVLPVMAFHAGFAGWQGGYLGVDVFFVISGYLITSIVMAEQAQGAFSLARFWERRARRILPLLSVVLLACLPPAWVLLGWKDNEDFAQSLVAVGAFASNLLFWREGTYFATAAEFKPLLHTWSLAVEEQFYLLFPLVCLAVFKWGKQAWFSALFALGLVASLGSFIALARIDGTAAFYLLPARGWQLLAGSLCALAPAAFANRLPAWSRELAGAAGVILIALGMLGEQRWLGGVNPAIFAVTGGTVLVILFAASGTLAARILSLRPLVAIGLISYGAYLWHVPLLVFARHALSLAGNPELERVSALPPLLALALCAASLLLAALTWRLVEQPFRNRQAITLRTLLVSLAAAWLVIIAFAATLLLADWQQRFHLSRVLGADAAQARQYVDLMEENDVGPFSQHFLEKGQCVFGSEELGGEIRSRIEQCAAQRGPGILLLGGSHAMDLHNVMANIADDGAFLVTIAAPGCRIGFDSCFYQQVDQQLASGLSAAFRKVVYTQAGGPLILDEWGRGDSQFAFVKPEMATYHEERIAEIASLLRELQQAHGLPLLVVGPYYEPRIILESGQPLTMGWVPRPTVRGQFDTLDGLMRDGVKRYGLSYASMMVGPLAPGDKVLDDGCLIYHDLDHLSTCGEARMAERLQQVDHPLARLLDEQDGDATPAR